MRDASPFLIDQDTETPLADVLKISKVLDSLDNTGLPEFDEKYMLGVFYRYIIEEEPDHIEEDISTEFIKWFNKTKISYFISDGITNEQYKELKKICQEQR